MIILIVPSIFILLAIMCNSKIFIHVGIFIFIILTILLPLVRSIYVLNLVQYNTAKITIQQAKSEKHFNENITLITEIIRINNTLAIAKILNNSIWIDWYILDEYAKLSLLK